MTLQKVCMVVVLGDHQIESLPLVISIAVSGLVQTKGKGNALCAGAKEVPKSRFYKCKFCSRMGVSQVVR